ncbi:MAG: hypothetical protein K8S14_06770, partial [Actinomycetia bacterium]|nr:hypothetical protein [Actinomycetes bacterium]
MANLFISFSLQNVNANTVDYPPFRKHLPNQLIRSLIYKLSYLKLIILTETIPSQQGNQHYQQPVVPGTSRKPALPATSGSRDIRETSITSNQWFPGHPGNQHYHQPVVPGTSRKPALPATSGSRDIRETSITSNQWFP